jgi:uncharacterized protein
MKPCRTVLWRNLSRPGAEYCTLSHTTKGWIFHGALILTLKRKQPVRFEYEVRCDSCWQTRGVQVRVTTGARERTLFLRVDKQQRWWQGSRELKRLRGCHDVDLFFSPSTNTLPIRRLQLAIGDSADVTAAWISSEKFVIKLLKQRYTRLARNLYRYHSATGFRTEIRVDDLGLVVNYPPGWERIASM